MARCYTLKMVLSSSMKFNRAFCFIFVLTLGPSSFAQSVEYTTASSFDAGRENTESIWTKTQYGVINLGLTSDWVVFKCKGSPNQQLLCEYPSIDSLVVIETGRVVLMQGAAITLEKPTRLVQDFILEFDDTGELHFAVKSNKPILLPLNLLPSGEGTSQVVKDVFLGGYVGLMLVMVLFNLFVYFSIKDPAYLVFILYAVAVCILQVEFQGYGLRFLWEGGSHFARFGVYYLSYFVGLSGMWFFASFLKPHVELPKLRFFYFSIVAFYIVSYTFFLFGKYAISYQIILGTAGFLSISILLVSIYLAMKGKRLARYYLISSGIVVSSVIVFVFKDVGVLPFNFFTFNAISIGSALEVTMLSFALADRINILTAEKKRSQNRALQVLKENDRIVREQNALLEEKVKERTKELEKSNQDLNVAYKSLQTTQSQLVEAEKMAGLGQMTAGIAHELNNPINYVSSNVSPLKRDVDEVFHVLDEYKSFTNKHESDAEVGKIRSLEKELDLPFLRIEIGQLLNGIREGAERSAAIVKGLRTFSRLDEDTLKLADINDGLESTLVILKSNYKGQCEVVKELDPNLPQVECFPGKLNQVFMNILNNAIQASVDSNRESPEVRVSTTTAGGEVKVHIADNGVGMSEEVKARIFEPFFTTKKVGEGTGLGLSIVLGIIEQHNGTIHVESAPGEGTEFVITLPLKPA